MSTGVPPETRLDALIDSHTEVDMKLAHLRDVVRQVLTARVSGLSRAARGALSDAMKATEP